MGSVTAPENIRWLIPVWAWFALVVGIQLRKSSPQVLSITIFFVFIASTVPILLSSRWSFSPLRFRLASSRGMRGCRDSDLSKRLSFYHGVFDAFTRVATASCGDVRFVIPSEVEQSLDISDHAAVGNIKRCLDFARHDNLVGAIDAIARSRFGEPH